MSLFISDKRQFIVQDLRRFCKKKMAPICKVIVNNYFSPKLAERGKITFLYPGAKHCYDLLSIIIFTREYLKWSRGTINDSWNCYESDLQLYVAKEVWGDKYIIRTQDFRLRISFQVFRKTSIHAQTRQN